MNALRKLIREILRESYSTELEYETGAHTGAANDLLLYFETTQECVQYARTKSVSQEDMIDVFEYVLKSYGKEMGISVFANRINDGDGSDDKETVLYDFMANYPREYLFPVEDPAHY